MTEPCKLSATEMADGLESGELTPRKIAVSCLDRIRARDGDVRAWAHLDPDQVLAAVQPLPPGLLHGIPVGVKDIIDTADMPTEFGSKIYRGHQPVTDAASVAAVRAGGGVVMGKTVTTEFAWRRANQTRNPHDPAHTPGGSSSGSAAAVADFQVPLAFGTQTGGSVIRPAAYCGVVGFKPSHGRYAIEGVKPLSRNLDTLGIFARSVRDIAFFDTALTGASHALDTGPPRLAVFVPFRDRLEEAGAKTMQDAARRLGAAGARVREIESIPAFDEVAAAHETIMIGEIGRALHYELENFPDILDDYYRENIARGAAISDTDIAAALTAVAESRRKAAAVFGNAELILTPPAAGPAPEGLAFTGDPLFNKVWTALHWPCLTLPAAKHDDRLPLGVQLVAPQGGEIGLLAAAAWVEAALEHFEAGDD
jgi:Asp-tRNA(Asn)/Glu-tRNA(Gln) amidotransferase A subunit family amidase